MKSNNSELYNINTNYIDLSQCIENEIEQVISNDELDKLIENTISKINTKPKIKVKTRRKIYSKLSKLVAAVLIVLALSTSTIYAISNYTSKMKKSYVPGKGLVDSPNDNILILYEPITIYKNGYEIEFINVSYDGKQLEIKVRSPYINKIENGDDILYTYTEISLYDTKEEIIKKTASSEEFTFEEVTQKCKFNISSLDGYYFSFNLREVDLNNYGKTVKKNIFNIPLSELPLEKSKLVFDKSELGEFSTSHGVSLLAYSKYKNGKQYIDIIYANEKVGDKLLGFGSYTKNNKNTISLVDKNSNVYKPINSIDIYGLYQSFIFDTNEEIQGELLITDIVISRSLNNEFNLPLPKENETIILNKIVKTPDGTYIVDKIQRLYDSSDNKLHLNIYMVNPVVKNETLNLIEGHIKINTGKKYIASIPYNENMFKICIDCDKKLISENELTISLDNEYITVNGNWRLNVNKREDVFKN